MKKMNVIIGLMTASVIGFAALNSNSVLAVETPNPVVCNHTNGNFVDANNDGICDNFIDANNDGKCDTCIGEGHQGNKKGKGKGKGNGNGKGKGQGNGQGNSTQGANFVDTNNDGVCDNHSTEQGNGRRHGNGTQGANFVDANNDGVCDNHAAGQGNGRRHGNGTQGANFVDANNDGVCDNHAAGQENCRSNGNKIRNNSKAGNVDNMMVFPNPAKNANKVKFELKEKANVNIGIYDVNGSLVKSIYKGEIEAGNQTIEYNIDDLKTGNYLLKLDANGKTVSRNLIIDKN